MVTTAAPPSIMNELMSSVSVNEILFKVTTIGSRSCPSLSDDGICAYPG